MENNKEIIIDLYDWDGTITKNSFLNKVDTFISFIFYCRKLSPELKKLFYKLIGKTISNLAGLTKTEELKNYSAEVFKIINDDSNLNLNEIITNFQQQYLKRVFTWFKNNHPNKSHISVVISATPEILLDKMCQELRINHLIATKVNIEEGRLIGLNCRRETKIKMLAEFIHHNYPSAVIRINRVYSDTIKGHDAFIGLLGEESYHVTGDNEPKLIDLKTKKSKLKYDSDYSVSPGINGLTKEIDKLKR